MTEPYWHQLRAAHTETDTVTGTLVGNVLNLSFLFTDDLREELVQEIRVRKKLEDDCRMIKGTN